MVFMVLLVLCLAGSMYALVYALHNININGKIGMDNIGLTFDTTGANLAKLREYPIMNLADWDLES